MQDYHITDQMRAWAKVHGWNADAYLEAFQDYLLNRTKKPYKNLDAAFRNCIRSDWFKLRKQGLGLFKKEEKPYLSTDGKSRWVPPKSGEEFGHWEAT